MRFFIPILVILLSLTTMVSANAQTKNDRDGFCFDAKILNIKISDDDQEVQFDCAISNRNSFDLMLECGTSSFDLQTENEKGESHSFAVAPDVIEAGSYRIIYGREGSSSSKLFAKPTTLIRRFVVQRENLKEHFSNLLKGDKARVVTMSFEQNVVVPGKGLDTFGFQSVQIIASSDITGKTKVSRDKNETEQEKGEQE